MTSAATTGPGGPAWGRWLVARATWWLLGWRLRAGLRSALGGSQPLADEPPTHPRRAVRTRPARASYPPYPYPSAA